MRTKTRWDSPGEEVPSPNTLMNYLLKGRAFNLQIYLANSGESETKGLSSTLKVVLTL
ncbi:hypothetical protein IC006_0593 [Sulfuracidifex tepidarius]|uniref:Uncharacterized protein n=1 Tax=Sulfuracidifex tepidarius TaxID=1294262 RepID=A0A510DT21_9CREN|nr:hypothetical protein IC006_0593 [Sulfuracidifex tepidarius]